MVRSKPSRKSDLDEIPINTRTQGVDRPEKSLVKKKLSPEARARRELRINKKNKR